MAEMNMELENDYKLPLRPWLIRKIDRGEIRNLKWLDMPFRTLFKIPWNRQGHPHWEQEYQLFKDWAIHRGNNVEEPDWTKMKANFRSVLNKSNDFEEVKDRRVEDQQTGNYRIYRLLNHLQVIEKTKQTNRRRNVSKLIPGSSNNSSPQGCTPDVFGSILPECSQRTTNQNQDIERGNMRSQSTYHLEISDTALPDVNRSIIFNRGPFTSGQCPIYPDLTQFQDTDCNQMSAPIQSPGGFEDSDEDIFITALSSKHQQQVENKQLGEERMTEDTSTTLVPESGLHCNGTILEQALNHLQIPRESIFSYQASLQYYDKVVKEEVFPDLRRPYRIHHGSDWDQTLEALSKQDSLPPFLQQETWTLPPQTEKDGDKYLKTVLDGCNLGVVVRSDENGNIFAERLCKARIYVYQQELSRNDIIKLERRKETLIFSYKVFIEELIQFTRKERTMAIPEGRVKIFLATVPHSRDSKGVVSLTLTSCVAEKIAQNAFSIFPEIEFSQSDSMDHLIKETSLIQIGHNKR